MLYGPHDVKFLCNVKEIKAYIIHSGKRVNDLFVLTASNSLIEKTSGNYNSQIWHARLGQLNMDKLKVMAKFKLVKGLPNLSNFDGVLCEGCQYGKAHRLPFDRSLSRCKVPLELIHSEFMGPTRTLSFSGYVTC